MVHTARTLGLAGILGLVSAGCAHMIEMQTVTKFQTAVEKKNLAGLQSATTEQFHQRALRHKKALDDLEILHLPEGKVQVVKVEDEGRDHKKVDVEVGEKKRKLRFELVRDGKSGKWLVDNVRTPQKRDGLVVARSITEQMDLLLTVREFLDAWEGTSRSAIIGTTAPELAAVLKDLPPESLNQLAKRVVGSRNSGMRHRPKATLDGKAAIVSLDRDSGKMIMKFTQIDDKWRVSDVAIESREDKKHVPSLLKTALVMKTADGFLKAYTSGDKRKLAKLCTPKLYRESLAYGDLTEFPLPQSSATGKQFEVTLRDGRANYIVPTARNAIVRITLAEVGQSRGRENPTDFVVEDVAIHQLDRRQEMRISSFFVSRAWVRLFAESFAKRDLTVLEKASSFDFNRRVWEQVDRGLVSALPTLGLNDPRLRIEATDFHGSVTEIHAKQGTSDVTYLLREKDGRVRVDDVLVLKYGQPQSLKSTLELAVPIQKFKRGIVKGDVSELQRNSSADMNRLVWKQTRYIPSMANAVPRFIAPTITSVQPSREDMVVTLGDERFGARVLLVNENSRWVVDDMLLIAGELPDDRAKLKHGLRLELAGSTPLKGGSDNMSAAQLPVPRGSQMPPVGRGAMTDRSAQAGHQVVTGMGTEQELRNSPVRAAGYRVDNGSPQSPRQSRPVLVDPDNSAFRDTPRPQPRRSFPQVESSRFPPGPLQYQRR